MLATGTNGLITQASGLTFVGPKASASDAEKVVSNRRKIRHADFSNKSHGRKSKTNRLWVVKSTGKDGDKWTVKTPKNKPSFRVRPDASGFAVSLSFADENSKRREPYLCYLSKQEWTAAKQKSLAKFVETMLRKLDLRKADEGNDLDKINALIHRVQGIVEPEKGDKQ